MNEYPSGGFPIPIQNLERLYEERHNSLVEIIKDLKGDVKEVKGDVKTLDTKMESTRDELAELKHDFRWMKWLAAVIAGIAGWVGNHVFGWFIGR